MLSDVEASTDGWGTLVQWTQLEYFNPSKNSIYNVIALKLHFFGAILKLT